MQTKSCQAESSLPHTDFDRNAHDFFIFTFGIIHCINTSSQYPNSEYQHFLDIETQKNEQINQIQ
jgi:hypothetical protein